jgi:hypothetical protein
MSSKNGRGLVGPENRETLEIVAVETDRIVSTVQTEMLLEAKKQTLTSYSEQKPETLQKSGSWGVRKEITVGDVESWAGFTDTSIALAFTDGFSDRRRRT